MLPDSSQTPRLILRPIADEDAPAIFSGYANDPEVTRFLTWQPHPSQGDTKAYIAGCLRMPPDISRTYVLVDRKDNSVAGAFDLRHAVPWRLNFGYVLARPLWGRGLMTEALTEVVRWALAEPSIYRIGAVCDAENIASARVMEKAGLLREGLLRRWLVHPNISREPRDCWSYAIVR